MADLEKEFDKEIDLEAEFEQEEDLSAAQDDVASLAEMLASVDYQRLRENVLEYREKMSFSRQVDRLLSLYGATAPK